MIIIRVVRSDINILKRRMGKVPAAAGNAAFEFAKLCRDSLKRQLISQTKRAPRTQMAERIMAIRRDKMKADVTIPLSALFLDRARPHYVSLKRGRLITAWAQKFYGGRRKTGLSSVRRTAKGGIQKGSFLYVTPDPFIEKGFMRVQRRLPAIVNRNIRQALAKG